MLNATRFLVVVTPILLAASSCALSAAEARSAVAGGVPVVEVLASVTGTVSVAGNQQRLTPLPVFKNRSLCGAQVPNETLLVGRHGGLRNAVLMFHPLDRKAVAQPMKLVLDNKQCAFAPHVQVATVGSDLLLKNSDPILHTVHAPPGQRDFVQRRLADMAPSDETAGSSRSHQNRLRCAPYMDERCHNGYPDCIFRG